MTNLTVFFVESFVRGLGKAASTVIVFGITGGIYMFGNWLIQNQKKRNSNKLDEMYRYVDLNADYEKESSEITLRTDVSDFSSSNSVEYNQSTENVDNDELKIDSNLLKRRNAISDDSIFKKMLDKLM